MGVSVPRMQRSAPRLRRGALLIRGPCRLGPGSAEQRCTLHRVRDTRAALLPIPVILDKRATRARSGTHNHRPEFCEDRWGCYPGNNIHSWLWVLAFAGMTK